MKRMTFIGIIPDWYLINSNSLPVLPTETDNTFKNSEISFMSLDDGKEEKKGILFRISSVFLAKK
jgi:hypothetical protein